MKRFFSISVLLLFSFCSKKEKQSYPRILTDKNPDAINVNTKTMLHRSLDTGEAFFVGNFDKNVSVAQTDLKEDEKYIRNLKVILFSQDMILR